jgi:hypothetical protein
MKYEYKTEYFGSHEMDSLQIKGYLNKEGLNRWELVQIITKNYIDKPSEISSYFFVFKRQLK